MYGLNLIHMIRDDVPPVEIIMLVRGLKLGSRFMAVLRGSPEFTDWDVMAYQMATLIDAVNYTTYAIIASNSGKRKAKEPKPSYRPSKNGRKTNNAFATQLEMAKKRKAGGG